MRRLLTFSSLTLLLPFLWLWWILVNHLHVEWTINPQYNYGWAVPFLCGFLIWRRVSDRRSEFCNQEAVVKGRQLALVVCGLLALIYAPTHLIEAANPDWRLMSWALAIEVVGMTLLMIYALFGPQVLAQLAFPVGYFLVAVPWPIPLVETPLIQGLTRVDTTACTELFGWLGTPVIPHGNVIELANGSVGIDEACSGIRSFQATLMISLFLGEFYRLNVPRRLGLVFSGFALSFLFNFIRTSLLVWVASRQGVAAIAIWHDPAGVTILIGCFLGLWGLGVWLGRRQMAENRKENAEFVQASGTPPRFEFHPAPVISRFAIGLCVWLAFMDISIQWWYRSHEAHVPPAVQWTINWPVANPTFKELPLPKAARQILRYDTGRSGTWREDDLAWQAVFLQWQPGQAAVHLAQNHTPDVCLTAAGHTLKSIAPQEWLDVKGLKLPFSVNEVMDAPRRFFVFYCLWDDRAGAQGFRTMSLTLGNRLAPVLAGLRNPGQRSLELMVVGPEDPAQAEAAVQAELQKLVAVKTDAK